MSEHKIFIGRLSYDATEDDLKELFGKYGEIGRITIPTNRETSRPRGFAFVEFTTEEAAKLALKEGNNQLICGRQIIVNVAQPSM